MKITPNDLDGWASQLVARSELPVLLRKLVHARAVEISHVEFPAYESTNDDGWDGQLVATGTDPWIPDGSSFWEMSCRQTNKLSGKASEDIGKRTKTTDEAVRLSSTFVFATPRRWPGKTTWVKAQKAKGQWRDVRVYDADTLSEWIEQAPAAQAFMSAQLGRPANDLTSLEDFWNEWSGVTNPRLVPAIFSEAFAENRLHLERHLASASTQPLAITGETRLEAAAFAACALLFFDLPAGFKDKAVVLKTAAGVQHIRSHTERMVLIIASQEAEGALGDLVHHHQVLIPVDRSGPDKNPGPSIETLTWDAFRQFADAMGLDKDARDRLERDSGRRIAILRRQLSDVPAVRQPLWASNDQAATALIALALAGGWNFKMEGDRELLAALGDTSVEEIEASIAMLASLPEAPIFSVAGVGGIVSRADAFTALRARITKTQLDRFFQRARELLSEVDPSLELEADQRWAANLYGKVRKHSGGLRQQMADTLTFLAVEGEALFDVSFSCEIAASKLIADLFSEVDEPWLNLNDLLQSLAEAAPDVFLKAIEDDLPFEAEDRGVWKAVKPIDTSSFSNHADRTELSWALERLLWLPLRFPRAARVLAALSTRPLHDNLVNKPSRSLYQAFQPWLAQTAAPLATRIAVLKNLDQLYPEPLWDLALSLADQRLSHANYSQRPRFRSDAVGHGIQPTNRDREIMAEAQRLLLGRTDYGRSQVTSLIERVSCFTSANQKKVWRIVELWAKAANPEDVAMVRENIRQYALGGRFNRHKKPSPRARAVYEGLKPTGLHAHAWLFAQGWVDFGSDELDGDEEVSTKFVETRETRIAKAREDALREIWAETGAEGVIEFAAIANEPWIIGSTLPKAVPGIAFGDVLDAIQSSSLSEPNRVSLMGGLLTRVDGGELPALLSSSITRRANPAEAVELLLAAPSNEGVWGVLDTLPLERQAEYWSKTNRPAFDLTPDAGARLLRELLAVKRPLAAFHHLYLEAEKAPTDVIFAVLKAVAYEPGEENGGKISAYQVSRCFDALDKRPEVSTDELAALEFAYAKALDHSERGLKALSKILSLSPDSFVHGIKAIYRDKGEPADAERVISDSERQSAELWHHIFGHVAYGPAGKEDGKIDPNLFDEWMARATQLLEESGRQYSGFYTVGEIIGRTRVESDGQWPDPTYAATLEKWANDDLARGLYYGIVNSRGVQWRDRNGGSAERTLAEKYRGWAEACVVDYPRLAACFETVARSYEHDAKWQDDRARLERTSA